MRKDIDAQRREASLALDQSRRGELGQFMTPSTTAAFMAQLFTPSRGPVRLLEAGAGIGSLIVAFTDCLQQVTQQAVSVQAYEIDPTLVRYLSGNLKQCAERMKRAGVTFRSEVVQRDFILDEIPRTATFTHAILNPPYKKIHSQSEHRHALRAEGMEHVNLYSAFVSLALRRLKKEGQLVAIIPRSFCNGVYYKPFRQSLLQVAAIRHLHLFDSRRQAFREDEVLQENVIVHLVKGGKQGRVTVSTSSDDSFSDLVKRSFLFTDIVKKGDPDSFIHIPQQDGPTDIEQSTGINHTLSELGLEVSTGPVVDFRVKTHLHLNPKRGAAPLVYPNHFNGVGIEWPKAGKKPNAISVNAETSKTLIPTGYYTVVKRFSSKEEKQRIVARVIDPKDISSPVIGLENHLNYFHTKKTGVPQEIAYGLAAFLNSSFVDSHFRSFNGHTQVNATDLKRMKYPSRAALIKLGRWAKNLHSFTPDSIDKKVRSIL